MLVIGSLILQIAIPMGILVFLLTWGERAIIAKKGTRIKYYHVLLSSLFVLISFSFSAYLGYFVFAEITGQLFYLTVLCLIINISGIGLFIVEVHIPVLKCLKNGKEIIGEGFTLPWKIKFDKDPEEETFEREEKEKEEKERLKPFWKRRNFWINTLINIGILWLIWEIWLK